MRARDVDELVADLRAPLERALAPAAGGVRPPLFLYVQPFDPHDPYVERAALAAKLAPGGATPPDPLAWQRAVLAERGPPPPDADPHWGAFLGDIARLRFWYEQEVRHTDDGLARLFDELERAGVLAHALVAVLSDHGEGLWDHPAHLPPDKRAGATPLEFFYQRHGADLYQEALATPLVLAGAGVPRGVRIGAAVENLDVFPTLLELARVAPLGPLDGQSLAPLLRGEAWPAKEGVFAFVLLGAAVREPATGLKLVLPTRTAVRRGRRPELYDLSSDPHERVDLLAQRPADAARLEQALARWTAAHPTTSTLEHASEPDELQALRDLGYTGEHFGDEPR